MIIIFEKNAKQNDIQKVEKYLTENKFGLNRSQGKDHFVLGVIGDISTINIDILKEFSGVENAIRISESYKRCSRTFKPTDTIVKAGNVPIGGKDIVIIAGPCSVENEKMVHSIATKVTKKGATIIRGGAYKPRSSPYSFQGLGEEGLKYLKEAALENNVPCVSELMSADKLELFEKYVDIIQIGARNMQNFTLLKELSNTTKPIMLKRGISATVEEWLNSAEYIVSGGNPNVILCERGIRTFENSTRFTLDLSSVPVIKKLSHLPIIVDPSHAMGNRKLVLPMARAAIAVGADGIMVEVHENPDKALSDGPQSLLPYQFETLMKNFKSISNAIGRKIYELD